MGTGESSGQTMLSMGVVRWLLVLTPLSFGEEVIEGFAQ
jgi:hypothetical protein